MAWLFPGRLL